MFEMSTLSESLIIPDWPAPAGIKALSTTRIGGVSAPPFDSFNLAGHVGDAVDAVAANRERLIELGGLPTAPCWLQQVHGSGVLELGPGDSCHSEPQADASLSRWPGIVCAVMTADCLPVLFCDERGRRVAAAHAGWRGLAAGVLEATVSALGEPAELLAWLGPAIGPTAFEVGEEVRQAFVGDNPSAATAFVETGPGKFLADLYRLAALRLGRAGVGRVYGGGACTFRDKNRFFSYRRDGATGRMASLIWRDV